MREKVGQKGYQKSRQQTALEGGGKANKNIQKRILSTEATQNVTWRRTLKSGSPVLARRGQSGGVLSLLGRRRMQRQPGGGEGEAEVGCEGREVGEGHFVDRKVDNGLITNF